MTAERVAERIAHPKLDYRAIDVDNHYYEPIDSCTRHLPKEFKRRGVQMLTEGKRTFAVMGGVVNHFIPNPTFDPIIEPGCLDLLFRGEIPEGVDPASLMKVDRLADHPEYQNRDARLKILDNELHWHSIKSIRDMAFDHKEILDECYAWLQKRIQEHPLGFNLLPEKFSLRELQNLYEAILDIKMDRRNFRKKFFAMDFLIDTGEYEDDVPHRPGKLYKFDFNKYKHTKKKWSGIDF